MRLRNTTLATAGVIVGGCALFTLAFVGSGPARLEPRALTLKEISRLPASEVAEFDLSAQDYETLSAIWYLDEVKATLAESASPGSRQPSPRADPDPVSRLLRDERERKRHEEQEANQREILKQKRRADLRKLLDD